MKSNQEITSREIEFFIQNRSIALVYFTTNSCSVADALKPKVIDLIKDKFPTIEIYFIDMNSSLELSAHYQVFVEPTIIVFVEGKETIRTARNISIFELETQLNRIYKLIF